MKVAPPAFDESKNKSRFRSRTIVSHPIPAVALFLNDGGSKGLVKSMNVCSTGELLMTPAPKIK
jgi:hypothetical protein